MKNKRKASLQNNNTYASWLGGSAIALVLVATIMFINSSEEIKSSLFGKGKTSVISEDNNRNTTESESLTLPPNCDGTGRNSSACDDAILTQFIFENSNYGLVSSDITVNRDESNRITRILASYQGSKIQKFANILSITSLTTLSLAENQLSGSIPSPLPESLTFLDLSANQISGTIPSLPPLVTFLRLNNNRLTGAYSNVNSIMGFHSVVGGEDPNCILSSNFLDQTGGPDNCIWQPQNNYNPAGSNGN